MTNIAPTPPHTVGTLVTEAEAVAREKLAALEASMKKDEISVKAWFTKNWLHIANAGGIAVTLAKLFGKL
jgi:hypothetical protein